MQALALMFCILGGILGVKQSSGLEYLVFDLFSFQNDGLATTKVDISWRQIVFLSNRYFGVCSVI